MTKLVDRVRRRRRELELSQAKLAARAGLHVSTIEQFETGRIKNPGIDKIAAIAVALQTSIDALVYGANPKHLQGE